MQEKPSQINAKKLLESIRVEDSEEPIYHRYALRRALLCSRYFDREEYIPFSLFKKIKLVIKPILFSSGILVAVFFLAPNQMDPMNQWTSKQAHPISFSTKEINMSSELIPSYYVQKNKYATQLKEIDRTLNVLSPKLANYTSLFIQ